MERDRIETPRAPGRPRSEQAHTAILDATMSLIREVGFDALTIEAVAARAGVGKATVYRWWPSKELLAAEAVRRIVARIATPDTGSVLADVDALMATIVRLYRDPDTKPLLTALVAAMARSAPIAEAVLGGFHASLRDAFHAVLQRGVDRGELPAGTDVAAAATLLDGPLFYRAAWTGEEVDEAFARHVTRVVLAGLRHASDAPEPR